MNYLSTIISKPLARSSGNLSGIIQPCGDANQLAEDQTHGYHPQPHQPSAIEHMQQGTWRNSFTYLGSLIMNNGSSSRDITSRIAKAGSAMTQCHVSPIKSSLSQTPHQHTNQDQHVSRPGCHRLALWLWSMGHQPRRSQPPRRVRPALSNAPPACVLAAAHQQSVNAPSNQRHQPSYDNAACAGSDISTACHPPTLYEESLTLTLTSMVGKDQEAAPKLDGLIQSSTTSTPLASMPSMLPRWSLADPTGRHLFADCQRSNPSQALKRDYY